MPCELKRKKRKRKYRTSTLLPLRYRDISKMRFKELSFDRAYRFYSIGHCIDLENHNFRKVIYDATFDALENKNGKIHRKDYLNEIEKFYNRYYQVVPTEQQFKLRDWDAYRKSTQYQEFLRYVKQVDRLDHRADITVSNALSYLHATKQNKNLIYQTVDDLERALGLDYIPELWSKSSLWFMTNVLFFHQVSFMLKVWKIPVVLDITKLIVMDYGNDFIIDLKTSKDWYDWDFYYNMDPKDKALWYIYDNVVAPSVGESGSVLLAEALKAGTSFALHFATKFLWTLARFHPALRVLGVGAYLAEGLKEVLDKSILAWLGWQIAVEWSLDGYIQMTTKQIGEALYRTVHGEEFSKAWDFAVMSSKERYDSIKKYFNLYKNILHNVVNYYKADKPIQLRDKITSQIEEFSNMGIDLGVQNRTIKLINHIRNIIKLFEAKWQLHKFFEHAKTEYGLIKMGLKLDIDDLKDKTKIYCRDNTNESRKNATLALLEFVDDLSKLRFYGFEMGVTSDVSRVSKNCFWYQNKDFARKAQIAHYTYTPAALSQAESLLKSDLSYVYDTFEEICLNDDAISNFGYYNSYFKSYFDFLGNYDNYYYYAGAYLYYNFQAYPQLYYPDSVNKPEDWFDDWVKLPKQLRILFQILVEISVTQDYYYYVGGKRYVSRWVQYYDYWLTNDKIIIIPRKITILNPAIVDIVKDLDTLNNILFNYINLYADAKRLIKGMAQAVCFTKNSLVFVPSVLAVNGLLRYSLRNKCFSVKSAKETIKKTVNADIVESIYQKMKQEKEAGKDTKLFRNLFFYGYQESNNFQSWGSTYYSCDSKNESFNTGFFSCIDKFVRLNPVDDNSFDLDFIAYYWVPESSAYARYNHPLRVYLLPSGACPPNQRKIFKKSKRSKVVCFI
jgi:hypothetical protein